jgi:hypothetical protein
MVYTFATTTNPKKALAELEEFPGLSKLEPSILRSLRPFSKKAQRIIDDCWSSVEQIAVQVNRTGSGSGPEIEALVRSTEKRSAPTQLVAHPCKGLRERRRISD